MDNGHSPETESLIKSGTVPPTTQHRCPGLENTKMASTNSIMLKHLSSLAYYFNQNVHVFEAAPHLTLAKIKKNRQNGQRRKRSGYLHEKVEPWLAC